MKKILIGFLFLLGAAEMFWPIVSAMRWRESGPMLAQAFDYAKFTELQQQAFHKLFDIASKNWNLMSCSGLATVVTAVLLLIYDSKKKTDA